MIRSLFFSALALCSFGAQLNAQAPVKQVTIHNESYYVYPFRIDAGSEDIPLCGYALPDGKYIAYDTYNFKEIPSKNALSFDASGNPVGIRKLIAKDTANISAVFSLRNNQPDGEARFYMKTLRAGSKAKAFAQWSYTGQYSAGLKEGLWQKRDRSSRATEHYNKGIRHGKFTYEGKDRETPVESSYTEGLQTGYAVYTDRNGKPVKREHYNSRGNQDSTIYYFNDGRIRITEAYRDLPPVPATNRVYHMALNSALGESSLESLGYYKEIDKTGKLVSLIDLKDPASYAFDSLLFNSTMVTVKPVNCQSSQHDCYEVHHRPLKPIVPDLVKRIDYYGNDVNYKSIEIYRQQGRTDTVVTVLKDTDSLSRPWELHKDISSIVLTRSVKSMDPLLLNICHYRLPALGIDFEHYEVPGVARTSLPVIDSVAGAIHFTDSLSLEKSSAIQLSGFSLTKAAAPDKSPVLFSLETYVSEDEGLEITPAPGIPDLILLNTNSCHMTRDPHRLLVNRQPYTGKAAYAHNHKPAFARKDSVLRLGSHHIEEYARFYKGSYQNGYQQGTWELSDVCRENCKSPRAHFDRQKTDGRYIQGSYREGRREGVFEAYEVLIPDQQWEKLQYGSRPVRYLSSRYTYANDTLQGPALRNQRGGDPGMSWNYNKGLLHGELAVYGDYGKTQVAQYNMGKLDGPFRAYFDNKEHNLQTSAEFKDDKLQGLLELYDKHKWLEIEADSGYVSYKKLFYGEGQLKEEIVLDNKRGFQLTNALITAEGFMTYARIEHSEKSLRPFRKRFRTYAGEDEAVDEWTRFDSINTSRFTGSYKSYFQSGQLYCEGRIRSMKPEGTWNFYNESGTLIHRVDFKDSLIVIAGDTLHSFGKLTGYYYTNALRCEALVTAVDVHYDCNTQKDLSAFETLILNNYDYYGKDNCLNGSGPVRQYNENGVLQVSGQMLNHIKTGLWKYYDPNQKLNAMGYYADNKKDGIWCEGDLEGINYEDAACFDPNDKNAKARFEYNKKELRIRKTVYKNGEALNEEVYEADMNRN